MDLFIVNIVGEESAKFTDLSLQVALGRVPCSQISLYRLLWGEYHVHRPLFTGCHSGLGVQGKCQVYRSLFTDPPLQVPSLPISLYRSLPICRWQKQKQNSSSVISFSRYFSYHKIGRFHCI